MSNIAPNRWLAVWLLASFWLAWASPGKGAPAIRNAGEVLATDPRLDMVTALKATGPHTSLGDQASVFGRLVGTWDVEYTDISKDGKKTHRSGEFIVGWVMDGRAIQDFWIVYPSGARKDREVYTDLRYYDPKSRTWPSTFIDPEHASVARFTGGAVGDDRIVLDTQDFGGTDTRWSINDIRPDSLVWREEESLDRGKTWRLLAEYHMRRRGAQVSMYRAVRLVADTGRHNRQRARKTIDTLIATSCLEKGLVLFYSDRDFDPFVEHLGPQTALLGGY